MISRLLHTPEGVRDVYGGECDGKLAVLNRISQVFYRYGYEEIETPTFEYFDIFSEERGSVSSREMFKFFDRDNRTLVLRTYHSASRDLLEEAFQHILHQLLLDVVEDCAAGRSVRQEDKEFLVRFYTDSLTGLILDWIGENLKESPEAIIRRLDTLLSGTIPNTLARFEEAAGQDPQMAG